MRPRPEPRSEWIRREVDTIERRLHAKRQEKIKEQTAAGNPPLPMPNPKPNMCGFEWWSELCWGPEEGPGLHCTLAKYHPVPPKHQAHGPTGKVIATHEPPRALTTGDPSTNGHA